MAYRRIHDTIATSSTVNKLTPMAHLAWPHLAYVADNFGRGVASPRLIHGKLFPLRDDISPLVIGKWLKAYAQVGLIKLYTVDGVEYFEIVNFEKYQGDTVANRRREASRFPPCPEHADGMQQAEKGHADSMPTSRSKHAGASCARDNTHTQNAERRTLSSEEGERPSISRIPPGILSQAEQFTGATLGSGDQQRLIRLFVVEGYDPTWFAVACAAAAESGGDSLAYVEKVLAKWRSKGGPPSRNGNGAANPSATPAEIVRATQKRFTAAPGAF